MIQDGEILAACQEERLSRIKHDSAFPAKSILSCLAQANCSPDQIDHLVFYEKPFLKFERLLETYLAFAPVGFRSFVKAIPLWLKEKLFQKRLLQSELEALGFSKDQCKKMLFSSHHLSHAASAFYPSPHSRAIVLTMDGVGEWDTTTVYLGEGNKLDKSRELHFPHSLGMLYSAFTYYCGFKVNSGEYKLMGLAPYGEPRFAETIKKHLVDVKSDGSFKLDITYFDFCTGLKMTNAKFDNLFGNNFRRPETELKQVHMDLAASVQTVLEEIILKICRSLADEYKIENLCLAGGVALNCVANGKIHQQKLFENIWVQPAAGDAGGALGAALACYYLFLGNVRVPQSNDSMKGSYLGPQYSASQIKSFLVENQIAHKQYEEVELLEFAAASLEAGQVIGWFQGQMEFGPRALGNRSILADPRSPEMQKKLNLKIKFRESFRPFAPAVIEEEISDWFSYSGKSPYMLMVADVHRDKLLPQAERPLAFGIERLNQQRSVLPAITHVDNSARIQTVSFSTNPKFYKLLKSFKRRTGTPVLINTSFNIRGEPIVCSLQDAYRCFMGTDLDILILENFVLLKENQPIEKLVNYKDRFALD